jgi:hypothetical protein
MLSPPAFKERDGMNKTRRDGVSAEAHIQAAKAAGMSLGRYARERGLSANTLYGANKRLQKKAQALTSATPASAFAPVELTASALSMKARLPNGIELEFGGLDASSWPAIAQTLLGLPCSR